MNNQMSLIKRAIARHYRLFHADERPGTFTRRNFVRSTLGATGALMSASAWAPTVARAQSGGAEPKPIPGGVSPFGIPVHHFPLPAAGTPLSSIHDPSEITDFNGFIVDTSIRGAGTDTVSGQSLAFKTDMGAMQGQYVGEDGRQHHGTFVFIWMDIFTGPVGSADITQQIHDYSPGIAPNGLFWIVSAPADALQVDLESASASLRMNNVAVEDAHDLANSLTNGQGLPSLGIPPIAAVPASVSFDIEWSGEITRTIVTSEMDNFTGQFVETGATIQWSSSQAGFAFMSESPNPARNVYSVIGRERNGIFFHARS